MTESKTAPEDIAKELRKPFPASQIGQLPRGGTTLEYVGHADVTSRLLEVDPDWNWEPKATDEHGLPLLDLDDRGNPVGLWIKLTVGGVTRLGYGSVPSGQNDAVKVLIGDALRNAAMRFGVALDLWAKGDRANPSAENATASGGRAQRRLPRAASAGDAFDSAAPAQRGQQAPPNGDPRWETAAPASDGQPPEDKAAAAQAIADEACQARAVMAISELHSQAHDTGLLTATIRDPVKGLEGKLSAYLTWRRSQLAAEAKATAELITAGMKAGLEGDVLDARVREITGSAIEGATVKQLEHATAELLASAQEAPAS